MRYDSIVSSRVDGPGLRVVLFLQGCSIHCPGCQNKHLWDFNKGVEESPFLIAGRIMGHPDYRGRVTISGGEPFDQAEELLALCQTLKQSGANLLVYSGYTFEAIAQDPQKQNVLPYIHRLVDGPFIQQLDHSLISYRGSSNQRVIDVQASLLSGIVQTVNWDTPQVIVDSHGNVLLPQGLSSAFHELGTPRPARRCGQTRWR